MDDRNRHPAFVSGFGGGKTYAGLAKAVDLSAVNRGLPMILMEPTFSMVEKIMWPTLFDELLDPWHVSYTFAKTDKVVRLPWGSELWFATADNPRRIVGTMVAAGYIDECSLISELAWKNADARVRHPKAGLQQLFATFTPDAPGWTYERWGRRELYGEALPSGYAVYQGTTADNYRLAGYAGQLLEEWDAEEAESRVYGRFSSSQRGRVYYNFDARLNVSPCAQYDPHMPLALLFDFNAVPGVHVEIAQERKDLGRLYVVDEAFRKGLTLEDACREVLDRYAGRHQAPVTVYGDASGGSSASHRSYFTIIGDFLRGGMRRVPEGFQAGVRFRVPSRNPSVADSAASVRAALCSATGVRSLLIHPKCRRLINDLQNVRTAAAVAEDAGRSYDGRPCEMHKGDVNLTHASDALRYWIWQVRPLRDAFRRQVDYRVGRKAPLSRRISPYISY